MAIPINNSYTKTAEADFVFALSKTHTENVEFKVIKNRWANPEEVDNVSVYNMMFTSFTEACYNYLLKNKTEVAFFENCVKDQFKEELKKFVEDKWREINETRMSKEYKAQNIQNKKCSRSTRMVSK